MRIISWNINQRVEPWHELAADAGVDVALLQEATAPPLDCALEMVAGNERMTVGWETRSFCTSVVRCSDRFQVVAEPAVVPFHATIDGDTNPDLEDLAPEGSASRAGAARPMGGHQVLVASWAGDGRGSVRYASMRSTS